VAKFAIESETAIWNLREVRLSVMLMSLSMFRSFLSHELWHAPVAPVAPAAAAAAEAYSCAKLMGVGIDSDMPSSSTLGTQRNPEVGT
jgi:hypothetical protein